MPMNRRRFVQSLAASAAAAPATLALAEMDGRAPITRAQWESLMVRMSNATLTCERTVEIGEGPFYYDSSPERRSLVEGRPGVPLRLGITVAGVANGSGCIPLAGAVVDLWLADATGLYSNVGADLQNVDTTGQTFLRGHQTTDDTGYVEFDIVVPGWEIVPMPPPVNVFRRTSHIHVKVFHERQILATQLYLPDALLDHLYSNVHPYKEHRRMTVPGIAGYFDRIRNRDDVNFSTSRSRPLAIERTSTGLSASAVVGFAGSMGTRGLPSRWK